jgi:hypothetical protein
MTTTPQAMVVQQPQQPTTLDYYGTIQGFETGQRIAKMFAQSNLVPDTFKNDIGGCLIALEMAQRMRANVLQVMQSLYIVHGKPSFSSAFLIACFNQTKRFTPIKYEFEGKEGTDAWGCRAVTTDKATGEEIKSVKVTIGMAKAEGWWSKKDRQGRETSKWQTMPELMLRYRSATFLIRTTAPEIALGFQTTEEVLDITDQATIVSSEPKMSLEDIAMQAIEEQPRENEEQKAAAPVAEEPKEAEPQPTPQEEPNGTIDFKDEPKPRKVPTAKHYTI